MKQLAVIIPVYINDNIVYLKKAVSSIISQTLKEFHIIIAVDGQVNENVNDYLNSLNHDVEIIKYNENRGLADTLNDTIKYAIENDYKYIARMDADDIVHPERFETQIKFLEDNQKVAALGTQAYVIDSNDNTIGIKDSAEILTLKVLKRKSDIIHPSVVFRSSFFEEVGYYINNVPPAEDYDIWFRAVKRGLIIKSLPNRLFYFRYDENLISRRKNAQGNVIRIKKNHLSRSEYYHLIPHYLIRFMPQIVLKYFLYRSIRFGGSEGN